MAASEDQMNLSEEERGNEELEHRFKQLSALENGSSSDEESANPHLPDGQEMTDELRGIVKHAADIIDCIKNAIKHCSEIRDKQTRLSCFKEALEESGFKIDTIFQTINSADSALEKSGLYIKPLQNELRALKDDIVQFQEHDSSFLESIPLLSQLTGSASSRTTIPISFTEIDDASYNDSYEGKRTFEEKKYEERDTTSSSSSRNSSFIEEQPEDDKNVIKMSPFPKSLSEKIVPFESSPFEDQYVQNALIQIKSIADYFDEISERDRSRLSEKDWRGHITLLEDNIALIQDSKEGLLREIRDDAIDLKWDLLKLYAEHVFKIYISKADADLREILEYMIAVENAIDKVKKADEPLALFEAILKVKEILIHILSRVKQSSKNFDEKEDSKNDIVLPKKDWRRHITELKRAIARINGCENISVDVKKPAINLPLKLLTLYAKQVFEIDMTEDDVGLQNVLEHIIAIRNAIDEAEKQDLPSEQLAALEEVLREEGILKEQEINIGTIDKIIENLIKKLNEHYPTLKKELNILKNTIQEYQKKGTEEKAEEDPFCNGYPWEAIGSGQYVSSDSVPPSDYCPTAASYRAPFNDNSCSSKKRSEKAVLSSAPFNDKSPWEEVELDDPPGQQSSTEPSFAPTSGPSIQVQAKTDVRRRSSKGEIEDSDSDSSVDEDDSAKKTFKETDAAAPLDPSFVVQAGILFREQLESLSTRINDFEKENETAYKVLRAIAITTLVLGVVIGVTAITWGIGPAALAISGAIAAHAAIAESVVALGALCVAGFFGRKCGKKEREEEDKLRAEKGQDLPASPR